VNSLKLKTFYAIWSVYADQVSLETNEAYAERLDELETRWELELFDCEDMNAEQQRQFEH